MNVVTQIAAAAEKSVAGRVAGYDWDAIGAELNGYGCAVLPKLLTTGECRSIAALYPQEEHFRSHIHMARHGFGKGEYRYFKYPLPAPIGELRTALYARIMPFANAWNERMKTAVRYPQAHADYLNACHAAGQTRPTPLLTAPAGFLGEPPGLLPPELVAVWAERVPVLRPQRIPDVNHYTILFDKQGAASVVRAITTATV